jgi:DNA-binding HxlR family transcriptional regulator
MMRKGNTNSRARPDDRDRKMIPEGQIREPLNADFPARTILALVGDKWTTVVLYCLSLREVRRFNELQRQIPEISKKMLVQTLRNLERDGIVERIIYAQVPPKTEYRLTKDGHRLREPIAQLCQWAIENRAFVATLVARRQTIIHPKDRE